MANGNLKKEERYYTIFLMKYSIHTAFRRGGKKTAYRALEVDKAVPLLKDPPMGRLTHPVRYENSKQYVAQKACLHRFRIKRLSLSKPSQF